MRCLHFHTQSYSYDHNQCKRERDHDGLCLTTWINPMGNPVDVEWEPQKTLTAPAPQIKAMCGRTYNTRNEIVVCKKDQNHSGWCVAHDCAGSAIQWNSAYEQETAKNYVAGYWERYIQLFGMPQIIGRYEKDKVVIDSAAMVSRPLLGNPSDLTQAAEKAFQFINGLCLTDHPKAVQTAALNVSGLLRKALCGVKGHNWSKKDRDGKSLCQRCDKLSANVWKFEAYGTFESTSTMPLEKMKKIVETVK